jgi:hypothetical protein
LISIAVVAVAFMGINMLIKFVIGFLFLLGLVLISKTTALALAVITFLYILYRSIGTGIITNSVASEYKNLIYLIIATTTMIFGVLVINELYVLRLEDRSNEVRELFAYIRVSEFLESPVFGTLYTGTPLLYYGSLHIPSHSVWLDMLASSGLLSIILFITPLLILIYRTKVISLKIKYLSVRQLLGFSIISFSIVMVVNPILFIPSLATFFWVFVGGILGMSAADYDIYIIKGESYYIGDN